MMLLLLFLLAAVYCTWFVYTDAHKSDGRVWGSTRFARGLGAVCATLLNLVGVTSTIVFTDDGLSGQCIGAGSPHGAFPVTQMCFALFAFRCNKRFDTFKLRSAGASVLFYVPLLRELLLLLGVRDAGRANLQSLLRSGYSVAVCPGGIWEMVNTRHDQEQIFLQRNLGFIRLAMRHGLPIVPIYTFGENQLFTVHTPLRALRLWIAQHLWVGLPLVTGRFGLPGLPFPVPLPTAVTHVVGRAVPTCAANPHPSDAELEKVLEGYIAEMDRIFRLHAPACLPPAVAAKGLRVEWRGHSVRVVGIDDPPPPQTVTAAAKAC
tara:strand:- start:1478 stop:2437 length:960 start_codon:yes stop_codon:yes gene_type:complete